MDELSGVWHTVWDLLLMSSQFVIILSSFAFSLSLSLSVTFSCCSLLSCIWNGYCSRCIHVKEEGRRAIHVKDELEKEGRFESKKGASSHPLSLPLSTFPSFLSHSLPLSFLPFSLSFYTKESFLSPDVSKFPDPKKASDSNRWATISLQQKQLTPLSLSLSLLLLSLLVLTQLLSSLLDHRRHHHHYRRRRIMIIMTHRSS